MGHQVDAPLLGFQRRDSLLMMRESYGFLLMGLQRGMDIPSVSEQNT